MSEEVPKKTEEPKDKVTISRREFLKDAGLIVGGATVGSMALVNACSTTTVTAPGGTKTITSTAPGGVTTVTTTVPVGSGVVTTTVPGPTVTKIVEMVGVVPTIKLTVNGAEYELQVKPNRTLRAVLRDQLSLTSIKDMCSGVGACGSCTVILNKRPVLSCMVLAGECDGSTIETSEGIADAKHPLIDAYILNYCAQCGYCTPGFVTTAKALLDRKPKATEADIKEALGGNICRCGTYPAHVKAVLEVASK